MTKKEKLKLIKELEQRICNLRAYIFYGYDLTQQAQNVSEIKFLSIRLHDVALQEDISQSKQQKEKA